MNRRPIQRPRTQLTQPMEQYKRCFRKSPHYYSPGEPRDLPPVSARQHLLELLLKPSGYDKDRLVCYPCGNHWHVGHKKKGEPRDEASLAPIDVIIDSARKREASGG